MRDVPSMRDRKIGSFPTSRLRLSSLQAGMGNYLLRRVEPELFRRIVGEAETIPLTVGQVLFEPGDRLTSVYFLDNGLVSMVAITEDDREVQAGTIGLEGAVGLSASGFVDTAFTRMMVQLPGQAVRVSEAQFARLNDESLEFRLGVSRYREVLTRTCIQSVACNALHSTQRRCARWILTAYEHAGGQQLPITQSFLADMLGVKRNAVSRVARDFQQLGLIRTHWGKVEVLNPDFLGDMACECFSIIRREIAKLV